MEMCYTNYRYGITSAQTFIKISNYRYHEMLHNRSYIFADINAAFTFICTLLPSAAPGGLFYPPKSHAEKILQLLCSVAN
jgi:hypothetical protein